MVCLRCLPFAACLLVATSSLAVSPQRTFVASNGNDSNPCSLTAPCRSFGAAIVQTASGGEVIVLDSAGYGTVTITQSVSITAPQGVYAGVSVLSGDGILLATPSINVSLKGLTITGLGGDNGIHMTDGASLRIEDCTITGFSAAQGRAQSQAAPPRQRTPS